MHPGNIKPLIKTLNHIRNNFPVFQEYDNLNFHFIDNEQIMAYSKTGASDHKMLCIVNLDTIHTQSATVYLNLESLGISAGQDYFVKDILNNDEIYSWHGENNFVILNPDKSPGHIFQIIEK